MPVEPVTNYQHGRAQGAEIRDTKTHEKIVDERKVTAKFIETDVFKPGELEDAVEATYDSSADITDNNAAMQHSEISRRNH